VVGGAEWSGEAAGGFDILVKAMQAVTYEWDKRGPATALSTEFIRATGAKTLDDLIEGMYTMKFNLEHLDVRTIFHVATQGDEAALEVVRWAGEQLGDMACGVIRQLRLEKESFDVVLIGSLFDGHPLMTEALKDTIQRIAPGAQPVRLRVPPVVGGVILGMQQAGLDARSRRDRIIETIKPFLGDMLGNTHADADHLMK
jgi:N-acetylglucosamine kinase-like BadF-type ATPase